MVDFTSTNPTKNPFKTGANINQAFVAGIVLGRAYPEAGKGTLVTFLANQIVANGEYEYLGHNGTLAISVIPAGSGFNFTLTLTGAGQPYSKSFTANAAQVDATTVRLTQQDGDPTVTFSQNNGSILTDGKIEINASWAPLTFYIDSHV